ncbi:MAG: hypothetical protein SNJ71_00630 [Bacteroidales bacterium]
MKDYLFQINKNGTSYYLTINSKSFFIACRKFASLKPEVIDSIKTKKRELKKVSAIYDFNHPKNLKLLFNVPVNLDLNIFSRKPKSHIFFFYRSSSGENIRMILPERICDKYVEGWDSKGYRKFLQEGIEFFGTMNVPYPPAKENKNNS